MQLIKKYERTDPDRNPKDKPLGGIRVQPEPIPGDKIKEIRFMASFAPDYEFDRADEVDIEELLQRNEKDRIG